MIFSSSHTSSILRKTQDTKRQTLDKLDTVQSLMDRKEMRVKKLDFESKVHSSEGFDTKEKEIKNLLEQHQIVDTKIIDHYKRETTKQEDVFQRKMRERKDRSVERSLSRSVDMGGRKGGQKKAINEALGDGKDANGSWRGFESQVVAGSILSTRDSNLLLVKQPTGDNNILTDSIVGGADKMDAFSHKKQSALKAKMSKMKMFDEEFAAKMQAGHQN